MQLLEGEEGAVARVFERISRDPRHRWVTVLLKAKPRRELFRMVNGI